MKVLLISFEYFSYILYEIFSISDKIINSSLNTRVYIHILGKFRRLFNVYFRKHYVERQLLSRKGECKKCGMCCNLLYTCPFLNKQGKCLIYGECRPKVCKVFPIDQKDIDEIKMCGGECGYYFISSDLSNLTDN